MAYVRVLALVSYPALMKAKMFPSTAAEDKIGVLESSGAV